MNQAIHFPEREEWDKSQQAIIFPVLVNGMRMTCAITGQQLEKRFGSGTPEQWLSAFKNHRWDIEDEAEQNISDGKMDAQGWLWLS